MSIVAKVNQFPDGVLVAMDSTSRNFLLFRWSDISAAAVPSLAVALR